MTNSTVRNAPKGWQRVKLGDISDITNGKANTQDAVVGGEYPLFDRSVSIKSSDKYLFDKTAVILPGEGAEFVPRFYSGKFNLHQRVYAIFPKDEIYPQYLFHYLYANRAVFAQNAVGSTVKSLRLPIIQKVPVLLPTFKVQKKIAEILSLIDEKIQKTDEIIVKTEKIKRGLMTYIFGSSKYEQRKIGSIANVLTGGTPKTSELEYWGGTINWMASGEVNQRRVRLTEKKITQKGLNNSNANILPIGTVMVALAGQGKTRGKVAVLEIETTCNQSLAAIIPNQKFLVSDFLFYNLESRYQELRDISGGEGRAGLNLRLIKEFEVPVPPLEEQKKTASILSVVDEKILINQRLKEKLVLLKKGLMKDLLSGENELYEI